MTFARIVGLWTACAVCLGCSSPSQSTAGSTLSKIEPRPVELIGSARLAGDMPDRSGLTDTLANRLPHNLIGSFGSGLAYTGKDDLYYATSDRGPADGASTFRDRFHLLRIVVRPGDPNPVNVTVETTCLFTDEKGRGYVGSAAAFDAADQTAGMRLDPEAIAVSRAGTVWTADEYGPWLDEWTTEGKHVRRIAAPGKFRIAHPGSKPEDEMPPHNTSGRQANRGLEGLAFSPDGSRLYALMQSPLLQDGAVDDKNKRIGTNIRMLALEFAADGKPGTWHEYVYQLEDGALGCNELLAVGDRAFLIIEKDGKPGEKARTKKVYRIVLDGATDVSGIASLPSSGLPEGVKPVTKTLLLDLLDPRFGLAGPSMPDKIEGLAVGPDLPDGRKLLLVASDNDYDPKAPSWVWAFAVDPRELRGQGTHAP